MKIKIELTLKQAEVVYRALETRYSVQDKYFESICDKFQSAIRASKRAK